jgi:hypothetical protein
MNAHAVRPDVTDDIPPLEELKLLGPMLKRVGLSLQAGHRWRLHPTTPLKCWKVGHKWMTTEESLRDFIRRRSAGSGPAPSPAIPVLSAARRRDLERAMQECAALRP